MTEPRVAIRLGTEGKGEVKSDLAELRQSGEAAFDGIADGARRLTQTGSQEADRLAAAYERSAQRADKAMSMALDADQRRAAQAAKLAAITPQTATQFRVNEMVGTGYGDYEGSAQRSANAIRELLAMEDAQIAKANALKAILDPLQAAQDRYNAELVELRTLAPHLTVDQLAQAEARLKAQLDDTVASHLRNATASGAYRAGLQSAGFQVQDFIVQVGGGTSALRAFSMQAPQFIGSLQMMTAGAESGAGKFAAFARILGGGWGVALGIAVPLVGMLAENLLSADDAQEKAGKSSMSLADAQAEVNRVMALDRSGDLASAARDLAGARMQQAVATIQAARAEAALAQAAAQRRLDDIADGAEQRQVQRIEVVPGSRQRRTVTTTEDVPIDNRRARGQGSLLEREQREARQQYDASTASLKRYQAVLEQVTSTTLRNALATDTRLIDAKLKLATANDRGTEAEARRDIVEREARLRLEATAVGTKERAAAEADYTRIVKAANAEVDKVRESERASGRARSDAGKAARAAAKDLREMEQALVALEKRYAPDAAAAREYREELAQIDELASRKTISGDQAADWRARARASAFLPGFEKSVEPQVQQEEAQQQRRDRMQDIVDQGNAQLRLTQLELSYRGRIGEEEQKILELERYRLDLKRQFPDISDEELGALVAQRAQLLDLNDLLDRQRATWDELNQAGEHMVDTVLDTDNFRDWGAAGKTVLKELEAELWKLAAINPIKNWLFGTSLPSLFGGSGLLGSLLGSSSTSALGDAIGIDSLRALAETETGGAAIGTEYASGGSTWLAENGPEIVNLPRGARVTPAAETRRLLSGANDNRPNQVNVYANDAVLADTVRGWVQEGMAIATEQGANRGAALAAAESRYSAYRSLNGQ